MLILKSRGSYKSVGLQGHLRILPANLGKPQLSITNITGCLSVKLSLVQWSQRIRLASWAVKTDWLVGQCHWSVDALHQLSSACQHSSSDVFLSLDCSVLKLSLEKKSNFGDDTVQLIERNLRLVAARQWGVKGAQGKVWGSFGECRQLERASSIKKAAALLFSLAGVPVQCCQIFCFKRSQKSGFLCETPCFFKCCHLFQL